MHESAAACTSSHAPTLRAEEDAMSLVRSLITMPSRFLRCRNGNATLAYFSSETSAQLRRRTHGIKQAQDKRHFSTVQQHTTYYLRPNDNACKLGGIFHTLSSCLSEQKRMGDVEIVSGNSLKAEIAYCRSHTNHLEVMYTDSLGTGE